MSIELRILKEVIDELVAMIKKQLEGNTLMPLTENDAVRELGMIVAILGGLRDKTEDESLKNHIWSLRDEAGDLLLELIDFLKEQHEAAIIVEKAEQKALEWCINNPAWERLIDIKDIKVFYKTYEEELEEEPDAFEAFKLVLGEDADIRGFWEENGARHLKVPYGFVNNKGEFFEDIVEGMRKTKDMKYTGELVKVVKVR